MTTTFNLVMTTVKNIAGCLITFSLESKIMIRSSAYLVYVYIRIKEAALIRT